MNIEIYGALFKNKGAELMLRSICEKVENNYKNGHGIISYGYPQFFDLNHVDILRRRFPGLSRIVNLMPKWVRNKFKIITDSELDYILDASGFAYGDQWGLEPSTYFIEKIKEWKNLGCGVILMPQAFGPFDLPGMEDAIKIIHDEVDFIFVRDKVSFSHINSVIGNSDKIAEAPDFTNLIIGKTPKNFKHFNNVAIIPNCRMLDKTDEGNNYLKLLNNIAEHLTNMGETPFFLIHEGNDDLEIAKKINNTLKQELPIYSNYNAIEIKGVIGNCKFVVSSRFHGLVSALSQGIPCLGTGWSHKYQCLFEDYNYPEGLLEEDKWPLIKELLKHSLKPSNYGETKDNLLKNSELIKNESKKTWTKVFNIIDHHKNNNG